MVTPSYASPTASSSLKTRHHPSPRQIPPTSPTTPTKQSFRQPCSPRKLKRPSTLTPTQRLTISQTANLHPIKPSNPSLLSPFSLLPTELRLEIYTYVIDTISTALHPRRVYLPATSPIRYSSPAILRVCRAIRIEAAYVYYALTPLEFTVQNLDFVHVLEWMRNMPASHRAHLTRNRRLKITVMSRLLHTHTYPPEGWLLDAPMKDHWKATRGFGDLYTVPRAKRVDFVLSARLMTWFGANSKGVCTNVRWRYDFEPRMPSRWQSHSPAGVLLGFAREILLTMVRDMQRFRTRGRIQGKGRQEAMRLLDDLDSCFNDRVEEAEGKVLEEWKVIMWRARKGIEEW